MRASVVRPNLRYEVERVEGEEDRLLEFSTPLPSDLPETARILVATQLGEDVHDVSEVSISPFRGQLVVTQESIAPRAIDGSATPLLELRLDARGVGDDEAVAEQPSTSVGRVLVMTILMLLVLGAIVWWFLRS